MTIATCGHKVDEGISCSVNNNDREYDYDGTPLDTLTYGTYCAKCVLNYYESGNLYNNEIYDLIELIKKGKMK